ncbi:Ser/Thr protein kinase RdoA involved in Cpx stress response, MazF antagonist [Nostoc flagelliforme CCNUN1]|uniref:Ser/Thr protein kinase RdoA involved in Cpx stress response, MazF antagonist n=1 Tax=Nostoc flagelliforme CCNUN1 TaxID=2038116 RepID=A0A2K8T5H7_9NOSO|nr:Ser/Thr protein kinase RdoA involved in Cpx stress response, MazF antagonist [Nostoc flagelliforme CCNUN1]
MHEQKQPVAYPIARKNGSFTTNILAPEGVRYIAVFNYAPGHATDDKIV